MVSLRKEPETVQVKEKEGRGIPVTRDLTKLKTISISKGIAKPVNHSTEQSGTNEQKNGPIESFSQEQFMAFWHDYAIQTKALGKDSLYMTLTKRQPIIKEDYTVVLPIENKSQEQFIEREKQDLLEFLREKLQNYAIQLQVEITQGEDTAFLYTNKEKFKKMAEKNPNLLLLQKRLNLDIDF